MGVKARCGDEGVEHIQVKKCGFGEGMGQRGAQSSGAECLGKAGVEIRCEG